MCEEIKVEVLVQVCMECWGQLDVLFEWMGCIKIVGDLCVCGQGEFFDKDNVFVEVYCVQIVLLVWLFDLFNINIDCQCLMLCG